MLTKNIQRAFPTKLMGSNTIQLPVQAHFQITRFTNNLGKFSEGGFGGSLFVFAETQKKKKQFDLPSFVKSKKLAEEGKKKKKLCFCFFFFFLTVNLTFRVRLLLLFLLNCKPFSFVFIIFFFFLSCLDCIYHIVYQLIE